MDTPPATGVTDSDETNSLLCAGCGYRLFGIDSARCPECGLTIDRTILGQSQLPWSHRKSIGRWRAFWRTVIRASFRPSKIALEVNRPVSLADARLFRRICIAMAWVPLMAWAVGIGFHMTDVAATWEVVGGVLTIGVGLLLFLFAMTGIPGYFFHPANLPVIRQNRAVALSHYGAAALAWVWIAALLPVPLVFPAFTDVTHWQFTWMVEPIIAASYAMLVALLFLLWSNAMSLLKHSTHCSAGRRWGMGLILPPAWFVTAALCLVGIPAIVLFVTIVVASFHG